MTDLAEPSDFKRDWEQIDQPQLQTWHCACGWWNVGHAPICQACAWLEREEGLALLEQAGWTCQQSENIWKRGQPFMTPIV